MKQSTVSILTLVVAMSAATQAWTISSRPALVRPQSRGRDERQLLCAGTTSTGDAAGDIKDDVQNVAYEATDNVMDAAEDVADEVSDSATDAADNVADAAEDVKERIDPDQAFEDKSILGKTKEKAGDLKDFVKDKAGDIKDKAVDVKDAVADKAVTAKDYVKDKASSVKEAVVGSKD